MAENAFPFDEDQRARQRSKDSRRSLHLVEIPTVSSRPQARGKFLFIDDENFWVKGVTYGTFAPDENGQNYPAPDVVDAEFAAMAESGINTVRLYTVPPRWLLDCARAHGLLAVVGLPWEQHVTFLDSRARARDIEARVREGVRACAGHPAILCYAVGNEIPASIVRWYGRKRIERFLKRLYKAAKAEDPGALVTYVNYPTTEYLNLSFFDLYTFNVYLESQDRLAAYLKRLHNMSEDKPVLLAEVGLDSIRNGEAKQAEVLTWQIQTSFHEGCCGLLIFAWTDEWHRGGHDIEDWDFGLTTRDRKPKLALRAVREAFESAPFRASCDWPMISVVVCSLNGAYTIRDTFDALEKLNYPNYEVILVNDGSTDRTATIAAQYDVRIVSTKNRGLSAARNTGWQEAKGEIVAYIDDDAYPDPDWLTYLARRFMDGDYVGVGGPNLPPPGEGVVADCVANAPGGPVHVLLTDDVAEHIPGCNMAYRVDALGAIGGFDPRFRAAGDDVDMCWRLQDEGWTIGFSAAAMVWHHRRNSLRAYWKQQIGYGKAEALLEEKWPHKYNSVGHLTWGGRLYGQGLTALLLGNRQRVYHGVWGSAYFQSLYQPAPGFLAALPLMPEWYLVVAILAGLAALGAVWAPMLFLLPVLAVAAGVPLAQAFVSAGRISFPTKPDSIFIRLERFFLTTFCHMIQPLARMTGRLKHGLTPWRRRATTPSAIPAASNLSLWDETWQPAEQRLAALERKLWDQGATVWRGDDHDRWDLEVRGGLLGGLRALMAIEEHGGGKQLLRFRAWPHVPKIAIAVAGVFVPLFVAATLGGAFKAAAVLGFGTLGLFCWAVADCASAAGVWRESVQAAGGQVIIRPPRTDARVPMVEWVTKRFAGVPAWNVGGIGPQAASQDFGVSLNGIRDRVAHLRLLRHFNQARKSAQTWDRRDDIADLQRGAETEVSKPGAVRHANDVNRKFENGDLPGEEAIHSLPRPATAANPNAK